MVTNPVSGPISYGSMPLKRIREGRLGGRRGGSPATASLMAAMCWGPVPQQPPTAFTQPFWANSRRSPAVVGACSS